MAASRRGPWTRPLLVLSAVIFIGALAGWSYTLAAQPQSKLANAAGIVSCAIGIIGMWTAVAGSRSPTDPVRLGDILPQARADVRDELSAEAHQRGLSHGYLMPLGIVTAGAPSRDVVPRGTAKAWSRDEFAAAYAGLVTDGTFARASIVGAAGSGKSTVALMTALGLAQDAGDAPVLPLLVSLGSWDPAREDFPSWMERQAVTFCPALRQIVVDRGSLFEHLVHSGKTVIILDDADELPADQREQAMTGLTRAMPDTCPFSVFSREAFPELKLLRGARLTVATPTATQVRDYLRQMIRDQDERTAWAPVLARLGGRRHGQMADLLTTPLFAFLAWRVCTAGVSLDAPGHVMTPQQLADLVDDQGVTVAQDELMDEYIRLCVGDAGRWRGREDRRWLHRLAREMLRRPGASLAWWDLTDLVPAPVRVAAPTVLLVLAYLATLHMPQGFTRGLAIGIGTGLVLGLLRGTTVRPYLAVTAGVLAAAAIAAVGAAFYGWRYGAADGVELGAAYALILLLRSRLIGSWQSAVISVIAIAAGSALATWAALAAGGRLALGGGPLAVFGSMATGIGLGTLASHVFAADLHDPPRPSQVDLRLAAGLGSPLAHIARVLPPIVLIGLIAGLGGVIQKSPHYGYQILIIFGLGIGLPLAVVSGLLRWRSQLLPSRSTATARTTFRNDWRVAVACVTLPAVVSTVIIALFRAVGGAVAGPGGPAGLHVPVWDGLVFGVGLGVVLASLVAASPAVLVAHLWLTLTRRLPWRLLRFLERYHQRPRQLLRQQGPLYQFAHMRLMDRLADSRE